MSKRDHDIIEYLVCCISEFALRFKLTHAQAYDYLSRFKGLDFLHQEYDIEHTYSIDDAVDDLALVCSHNGGYLK